MAGPRTPYLLITANRNYSSWSLRPWLLMKQLGLRFEDRVEPFTRPDNREAFRTFAPNGMVPVLIDEDRTIWDSLAIVMYLAERHGGIWPEDAEARAFAMSGAAEMHSGFAALRAQCPMNVGVRVSKAPHDTALSRDVARMRELFQTGLERFDGPWLAGPRFSALDAFFAPVAFRVRTYGLDAGSGQGWVERMIALPAMQEWEAAALAESWREESHEAELVAAGRVLEDFRAA